MHAYIHIYSPRLQQQVRVMEISSQTAVCQLSAPPGVGPDDPYPCLLHWHSSRELLVGWADSFRQVDISGGSDGEQNSSSGAPYSARIAAEWTADCLISGLCSFDREHVAYLGYTPPDEDAIAADDSDLIDRGSSTSNPEVVGAAGRGSEGTKTDLSAASDTPLLPGTNQPEFCIARRRTGELLSADVLPLRGENMDGPSGYTLLTSHQCAGHQSDALKWDVKLLTSAAGRQSWVRAHLLRSSAARSGPVSSEGGGRSHRTGAAAQEIYEAQWRSR